MNIQVIIKILEHVVFELYYNIYNIPHVYNTISDHITLQNADNVFINNNNTPEAVMPQTNSLIW